MKKAYLAIGLQNRQHLSKEVDIIRKVMNGFKYQLFVFVDEKQYAVAEEKEMMRQAFAAIDASDLILAEVSEKAIGVGIEIGYAVAKKKRVIYLRQTNAAHSSTASGAAQYSIFYHNSDQLAASLEAVMASQII